MDIVLSSGWNRLRKLRRDARCSTARSLEPNGRVEEKKEKRKERKKKRHRKTKVIRICTNSNYYNKISRRRIFINVSPTFYNYTLEFRVKSNESSGRKRKKNKEKNERKNFEK